MAKSLGNSCFFLLNICQCVESNIDLMVMCKERLPEGCGCGSLEIRALGWKQKVWDTGCYSQVFLGGSRTSRTKLISKLYSGLLQTSTFCHFRNTLSSKLYVSFNSGYSQTVCQRELSAMHLLVSRRQAVCAAARAGKGWEERIWKKIPFFFSHKELECKTYYLLCAQRNSVKTWSQTGFSINFFW